MRLFPVHSSHRGTSECGNNLPCADHHGADSINQDDATIRICPPVGVSFRFLSRSTVSVFEPLTLRFHE